MIHSTSNYSGYPRTGALAQLAKHAPAAIRNDSPQGEQLSRTHSESLVSALNSTPEIRPEVVQRAKALAVDLNYPPRQIIEQLSKLIIAAQDPADQP